MPRAFHKYGSLVDRVTKIFFDMSPATVERVLQTYRMRYGDGAYAYAKRTLAGWKPGQVRHVGQTVMRLLEIVPLYVDRDTKFELVRILREETLRRLRQYRIVSPLAADEDLSRAIETVFGAVRAQEGIELPPGYFEVQAWVTAGDAAVFQKMIRDTEQQLLLRQGADFVFRLAFLQKLRREIEIPLDIRAVFEIPTARIEFRVVRPKRRRMTSDGQNPQDDHGLLAQWQDYELESRFKAGEVSYPEYVLRNMDGFFTKEEQSELHKIAAMHGLELERLLMEIQIKSRTSEQDLQKLLSTLRTLQEKGIAADVISRHETPSGHIEISAKSRRKLGCLPFAPLGMLGLGILAALILGRL